MPGKPQTQRRQGEQSERIRKDAEGQFAPKQHGGDNDGLDSAEPVATSGDGDATFDNDPGDSEHDGR